MPEIVLSVKKEKLYREIEYRFDVCKVMISKFLSFNRLSIMNWFLVTLVRKRIIVFESPFISIRLSLNIIILRTCYQFTSNRLVQKYCAHYQIFYYF